MKAFKNANYRENKLGNYLCLLVALFFAKRENLLIQIDSGHSAGENANYKGKYSELHILVCWWHFSKKGEKR